MLLLPLLINQAGALLQPEELGPEDEHIHLIQKIGVFLFCDAFRWDCTTLLAGSPEGIRSSNESGVVTLLSAG